MSTPLPALGLDRMDFEWLGLEAQYRITCQLLERYISELGIENTLGPHNPKGNIVELESRKAEFSKRKLQQRLLFAAAGRTPPDYDAYKQAIKEMKREPDPTH